jgi:hypothetical protein
MIIIYVEIDDINCEVAHIAAVCSLSLPIASLRLYDIMYSSPCA